MNSNNLNFARKRHPGAIHSDDFRRLFDQASKFDAAVVSTCEHTHAFATLPALQLGKHVYCEKPLTHNVWEARVIREAAEKAKAMGSTRFCMGAAWRNPKERDMPIVLDMIKGVKALGMESCMTLGMLDENQAKQLQDAGLDYYNHNADTSPEHYNQIITTRTYQDRLDTLDHVRNAGMKVCSGGIVGLGENAVDRSSLLVQLANLPTQPESVPINMLVKVEGTPLADVDDLESFDFIRCIAVARIMMPKSHVRLSAGRSEMNEQMQSLCFLAGANSIFYGCKLLTTENPETDQDTQLFKKLGINTETIVDESQQQDQSLRTALVNEQHKELFYDAAH